MNRIENHSKYLFIFAHPDDEVYSCGLMHRLIEAGSLVSVAYVTSGDSGGNPSQRESELQNSMDAIGINPANIHLLRFTEIDVIEKLDIITETVKEVVDHVAPNCVVGMDYEGGHEVHDSASFVTSRALLGSDVSQYVFPAYHTINGQRQAGLFLPGREATDVVKLKREEVDVKIRVLGAHCSQIRHFLHLQRQSHEYFQRLFNREVYREVVKPINYTVRPSDEVGYESHRNGFKFEDFKHAVEKATQERLLGRSHHRLCSSP